MLIAVSGASSYGSVVGVDPDHPSALLVATTHRVDEPIVLLVPQHAASLAREQAHVVVAAHPHAAVCVLPLNHHALTLVLLADAVLDHLSDEQGGSDPALAVQLLRQGAARSRSVLWYPRLWGLTEPAPTLSQSAAGLIRATGYFSELGAAPAAVSGRRSSPFAPDAIVHVGADAPPLLRRQLGASRIVPVDVAVAPAPYWARTTVELSVLVAPMLPGVDGPRCPTCGVGLFEGQCVFCGHGPVPRRDLPRGGPGAYPFLDPAAPAASPFVVTSQPSELATAVAGPADHRSEHA